MSASFRPTEGTQGSRIRLEVGSPQEVDALLEHVWNLGARVINPAAPINGGGYVGDFKDPDGFLWEVVYSPDVRNV